MLILRILIVFVIAIVGYFVGFGIGLVSLATDQPAWKQLPPPPEEITKLIPAAGEPPLYAAGEPPLYIETLDGNTYHFQAEPLSNWVKDNSLQNIRPVDDLKEPCDLDDYEFSISPAPTPADDKCF